jgi:lactoylglutathione lyase
MADEPNDVGFTHLALVVRDMDTSIDFYTRYAGMRVVHDRDHDGTRVAWLSDLTRPFAIVLAQGPAAEAPLGPFAHLGIGVESTAEVDRLSGLARGEGRLVKGPADSGPPIGYWAFLTDPDGNTLELAFGQHVALTIDEAHMTPLPEDVPAELVAAAGQEVEYPADETDEG